MGRTDQPLEKRERARYSQGGKGKSVCTIDAKYTVLRPRTKSGQV